MTETKSLPPLTICIHEYVCREVEKECAAIGITDEKAASRIWRPSYRRILEQTGQRIMAGTLTAYTFYNGKPQAVSVAPKDPIICCLVDWLDGHRGNDSGIYWQGGPEPRNHEWIEALYIEDIDLAAELFRAKERIAELESRLAALETGGVQIEGREAHELDAAISLYRAVASRPLPDGMTASQALTDKAESMFPSWRMEAIKRVVAVCNWDKTTGRKRK